MQKTTLLNIELEKDLKEQAEKFFQHWGISLETAVNIFLRQTIECRGMPFEFEK